MGMWFSRTGDKPSTKVDSLGEVIRQANASAAAGQRPDAATSTASVVPIPVRVITELSQISAVQGKYTAWSGLGLHANFNKIAAFFLSGPTSGTLLVASDKNGSAQHLEILQRLKMSGYQERSIKTLQCTAEVLQAFHASQIVDAADVQQTQTEIEIKTWELLESALKADTSDIHIETREKTHADVFFRINNERIRQATIAFPTAVSMARSLFASGDAGGREKDWSENEIFDISISKLINGKSVQVRFHSSPIWPSGNFQVVCRLLVMSESSNRNLSQLGYTQQQQKIIRESLIGSQGVVLLVGPTNSGKSTTMQALAHMFATQRPNAKISTAENPVEYKINGACQMSIATSKDADEDGRKYGEFVKATLRQDADLVVIGEIRDESTVDAMKSAGLAGRKIFATLHVFEALASFQRLKEMGLSDSVMYMPHFINAIIYQRLVPTICPHCAMTFQDALDANLFDAEILARLSKIADIQDLQKIKIRNRGGCNQCNATGISGRTICAEVLKPDTKLFDFLRENSYDDARNYWLSDTYLNNGYGVTAIAHGIEKMLSGLIDPYDLENNLGMIRVDRTMSALASIEDMHHHASSLRGTHVTEISQDTWLANQ